MTQESLEGNIRNSAVQLIQLAEDRCWNKISHHLTFIVSDFNEFGENFRKKRKLRNKINKYKVPQPLDAVIGVIKKEYQDLYDINLYIFKALQKETIIEIQYYRKSNRELDYHDKIKDYPPMLHAKITQPGYSLEGEKFDVNWESGGGLRHYWKNFLYKWKYRRNLKKTKEIDHHTISTTEIQLMGSHSPLMEGWQKFKEFLTGWFTNFNFKKNQQVHS
ncbi:hypothetical protein B0A69_11990 [Chryseobacterium shigense]|uniref:Uncharacterized protein n=1 Tax=Chryseobacterium shigense TaxID=297244 RepID=A0A1N7JN32_9FLAO|nr:hypothetical protein [Chryseobacterium shigense]PQA92887.1 hypothetical protein B0A69_11990 [Chryseobacterium shigense]SIS50748.1 hypothetical protein SAMN05421639_10764 [Chryseobacterium shigense]